MAESKSVEASAVRSPDGGGALTAAQRARAERQRQRARQLADARARTAQGEGGATGPRDTGGGFLLEEEPSPSPRPSPAPPQPSHGPDRPRCSSCGERFSLSHLHATFGWPTCDECRDDEGAHALVTRTDAKSHFLLQDCDLDARSPPLRSVSRPNPHRGGARMRLYLWAAVERRAHEVWGGAAGLEAERARREERRTLAAVRAQERRMRALRMEARSSLFRRSAAPHAHRWGPERHDAERDEYWRECEECGLRETYEKM